MCSSSAEQNLSVIVAWNGPSSALEACLGALAPQRDGVEVVVCEAHRSPSSLRERFSWARFVERPGELVPELWRDGIAESGGETVALTIGPMIPADDWVQTIRTERKRFGVVAGAIEPGPGLRLRDWGEYFCRYTRDMLPFTGHECLDLPGDNAAYDRELLERTSELYSDGFWEPVVHRRLAEDGVVLWHAPELVVRQGRSAGWLAFVRQRLEHGRAHGRQRGARFTAGRNIAGALGAPLVPALLSLRILQDVTRKRRNRLRAVLALPVILSFNIAWALGEAVGHLDALRSR